MLNCHPLEEYNIVFVTLDSCRFDTAQHAKLPFLRSVGSIERALTHGSYTVPAHTAFFTGHLPTILNPNHARPFYSEGIQQLWKISTGRRTTTRQKPGISFEGNDIFDGYRRLGYSIFGIGGVTQFAEGSQLREFFLEKEFKYVGLCLDEEPLQPRESSHFPLNYIHSILGSLTRVDRWCLFINCPETHYPYDIGEGIEQEVLDIFPTLAKWINLRGESKDLPDDLIHFADRLKSMQIHALESIDAKLSILFSKLPKNRPILFVVCGDHGENFGEPFEGRRRWGHLFPSPEVLTVPLMISTIKEKK